MLTDQQAWIIYLVSSLGAYWMLMRFSQRWIKGRMRALLAATAAVFLFLPWPIGEGFTQLAPAFFMFVMEGLFDKEYERIGIPLLVAWVIASVAALLIYQSRIKRQQHQHEMNALEKNRQALLEESQQHAK